ncbi:MAG: hypothetical protein EBU90_30055 [Proteobacteria bacterium]|nr:hypothetical protein [Pseudomonadota bacterium]
MDLNSKLIYEAYVQGGKMSPALKQKITSARPWKASDNRMPRVGEVLVMSEEPDMVYGSEFDIFQGDVVEVIKHIKDTSGKFIHVKVLATGQPESKSEPTIVGHKATIIVRDYEHDTYRQDVDNKKRERATKHLDSHINSDDDILGIRDIFKQI